MKERLLFSNKDKLAHKALPPMFGDYFPLSSIHGPTGALFSQDSQSVGLLIDITAEGRLRGLSRILHTWLRTTDRSSVDRAINISLFQKRLDGGGGVQSLISVTVSNSAPPQESQTSTKNELKNLLFNDAPDGTSLQLAVQSCLDVRDEILFILNKSGIEAAPPATPAEVLALVRFFWTAEPGLAEVGERDADSLVDFFSRDYYICQDRSFWKEKDRIRLLFNLRRATGQNLQDLHQALIDSPSLSPGTLVINLATGGRSSLLHNERTGERGNPILTNALYYAALPWDQSVGKVYGSLDQWATLSKIEHKIVSSLLSASPFADWHLHDMTWAESLYASVPGAIRLDYPAIRDIFDAQLVKI